MMKRAKHRKAKQGAVSVEIVVMLPVFVALLFAVSYFHRLASATQEAGVAARACAWSHALAGCAGALPPVCAQLKLGEAEGLRVNLPGSELEVMPNGDVEFQGSWFDAIAELPILGSAMKGIFGVGQRIKATREVDGFVTDDKVVASASNYVICNVKAESWSTKISELLDMLKTCDPAKDALCKD